VADDVLEPAFRAPDGWQIVDRGLDRHGVADAEKSVAVYNNFAYREAGDKAPPARWTFRGLPPDDYRIYVTWPFSEPAEGYRSPNTENACYTVTDGAHIEHISAAVNQQKSPRDHAAGGKSDNRLGRPWLRIGEDIHVSAAEGSEDGTGQMVITLEGEDGGRLVADAVCIERVAK